MRVRLSPRQALAKQAGGVVTKHLKKLSVGEPAVAHELSSDGGCNSGRIAAEQQPIQPIGLARGADRGRARQQIGVVAEPSQFRDQ